MPKVTVTYDSSVHRFFTDAFERFTYNSRNADVLAARVMELHFVSVLDATHGWIELECSDKDLPANLEILKKHLAAPIAKGEHITEYSAYTMISDNPGGKHYTGTSYHQGSYIFGEGEQHA